MIAEDKIGFYVSAAVKGKVYTKKEVIELGFDLDDEPITCHYTHTSTQVSLRNISVL